jgi:hypothetical protein
LGRTRNLAARCNRAKAYSVSKKITSPLQSRWRRPKVIKPFVLLSNQPRRQSADDFLPQLETFSAGFSMLQLVAREPNLIVNGNLTKTLHRDVFGLTNTAHEQA